MSTQQCTYCSRQFTRAEHLLRHIRSHTKEKPFKCVACGKGYAREDSLIRHAKSHCVARPRVITLRELPVNHAESGIPQNKELPTDGTIIMGTPGDISATTPVAPVTDFSTETNMWNFDNIGFMDDSPTWTINSDIFVNGVNVAGRWGQLQDVQPEIPWYLGQNQVLDEQRPLDNNQPQAIFDMKNIWFSSIQRNQENGSFRSPPSFPSTNRSTSQAASSPREPELVNDEYRQGLTRTLIPRAPQQDLLPSSEFLNLCVRRYLKCFNPIFPIIHAGTLQPSPENGRLLISMASVGCLFLGSQAAIYRGRRIFETLHKAILASWDHILDRTGDEFLATMQAAILGQTFAMLSGDGKHFAQFDAFHGTLISLARREKRFEAGPITHQLEGLSDDELDSVWKTWARKEEMNRLWLSLHIHDAELSALLHHEPLLKHNTPDKSISVNSLSFSANTSAKWAAVSGQDPTFPTTRSEKAAQPQLRDSFTAYAKLEGLGVLIAEGRRQGGLDEATFNTHQENLLRWHETYAGFAAEEQQGQLCLITLWHWTYMTLLVDFDQLELAIGRDGLEAGQDALTYVSNWASTPNSSRCMLHAFLIQKQVQTLRLDDPPAIHIPRVLFSAAIAWHCYIHYGPGSDAMNSSIRLFDTSLPEFGVLGSISQSQLSYITSLSWNQGAISSVKAATLCEIGGLLQRITQWGLAGKFASIVTYLISGEP